jgi:hypothetical protein
MIVPASIAALPIADARLIQHKRGKSGEPTAMYKQGSWIVEKRLNGDVETAQEAATLKSDGSADLDSYLTKFFPTCAQQPAPYLPGEYHPRVHRVGWPNLKHLGSAFDDERRGLRSFLVAYSTLMVSIERILRVVEPTVANLGAYGHEIRQALILASTEVEAGWRGVLVANRYVAPNSRFSTNDYVKLLGPMKLDQWTVRLRFHPDIQLSPLAGWSAASSPTQSLAWYDAYNAVKHDREAALPRATLQHLLNAIAAANVLGRAQFGHDALEGVTVPDLVSFDLVAKPQWPAEELYFKDATPIAKPLQV